jgi:hypothetical protein
MLKRQGIIDKDPTYVDANVMLCQSQFFGNDSFIPSCLKLSVNVTPREKNQIFDNPDKSKVRTVDYWLNFLTLNYKHSKKLAKLLQSKNPQDLEEANRLIKLMVQQV